MEPASSINEKIVGRIGVWRRKWVSLNAVDETFGVGVFITEICCLFSSCFFVHRLVPSFPHVNHRNHYLSVYLERLILN